MPRAGRVWRRACHAQRDSPRLPRATVLRGARLCHGQAARSCWVFARVIGGISGRPLLRLPLERIWVDEGDGTKVAKTRGPLFDIYGGFGKRLGNAGTRTVTAESGEVDMGRGDSVPGMRASQYCRGLSDRAQDPKKIRVRRGPRRFFRLTADGGSDIWASRHRPGDRTSSASAHMTSSGKVSTSVEFDDLREATWIRSEARPARGRSCHRTLCEPVAWLGGGSQTWLKGFREDTECSSMCHSASVVVS